ncbi:MAG: hypothetical protein R8N23_10655 [Reichenbachiella sp.]|uniref:hypothetical protein n=1 Tax=Reichenbachiella sp. TaxID=2184521 RepID=UPI002966D1A0|nr:hypothetical protein [Reichenbachiella sp.]MDW3210319.1 hypothetical protein [Reichenbachiella sp.]
MNVFHSKADIEDRLTKAFREKYKRKDVVLTGILLARPEDKLTKSDILPHLNYWHYRSDYYADFFCAGYIPVDFENGTIAVDAYIDDLQWGFSHSAFVEIVEDIENTTDWSYNGDPTLILINAYFDENAAKLDFHRLLRINFRELSLLKNPPTPTSIAENVFEFAKKCNEDESDPIWELSTKFGRRILRKGIKTAFLSWLPKWLSPTVAEAMQFEVVHEI